MKQFGAKLRALRRSRGLTQAELGRGIGMAVSTVSMYESGKREPDIDTISAIAQCLKAPMTALVGEGEGLAADEKQLLCDFRAMDEEGRRFLIESARLARRAQALPDTLFPPG